MQTKAIYICILIHTYTLRLSTTFYLAVTEIATTAPKPNFTDDAISSLENDIDVLDLSS